jgi:P4 family phage/plasmid primase-like protien
MVKIPETLIEKLSPFGGKRFIKIEAPIIGDSKTGKRAVEHEFQNHPYEANSPELDRWLDAGGNYGILCGEGIAELDIDNKREQQKFEAIIKTFAVKSGRASGEGRHYLIRTDASENGVILDKPEENGQRKNLGNLQVHNKYVVGPGSHHYSGGTYEIVNDSSISWVGKKEFEEIFGTFKILQGKEEVEIPYFSWAGKTQRLVEEEAAEEGKLLDVEIPIAEVVPKFDELRRIKANEFQGSHPVHDSMTGQNFSVNTERNCWHCFRCNSGGGPLLWLAVQHGLIRCDEAQKGVLRGELFLKTLQLVKEAGYEIQLPTDEQIEPDVANYFEGNPPRFVPAFLARDLMQRFRYVTRETDELTFLYHPDKGIYTPNGEAHLKREISKALGKHLRKNRQNEVLNFVACSTLKHIEETPPHLIALKNGIFDLKTKKLLTFDPEYFILNSLPVKYNANADCPKFKDFLTQVMASEDIPVCQEGFGYSLWRDYQIHKAFMLVGDGANGKSTLLAVWRSMLGTENVCTIPLHDLETSSFARSSLFAKLANIYPDLTDRALSGTGFFKMLTGGDTISAEYKFRDRFEFKNYAKLIFSCNKVPESPDDTTAFFRRWIIINFPNQFLEGDLKTDPDLLAKLTTETELSGIFNLAIQGLERLLQNRRFSTGKSVEETREQYIRASDPIKAFAMDCIEEKAGHLVSKDDVYRAFLEYCQKMHLPSAPKNRFSMALPQHVLTIQSEYKVVNKHRVAYWRDVSLIQDDNDDKKSDVSNTGQNFESKIDKDTIVSEPTEFLSEMSLEEFTEENGGDN